MPMNPEIKAEWLAALRSGEFKQAQGVLQVRDTNAYCCLGVLCRLAVNHGVAQILNDEYPDSVVYAALDGSTRSSEILPRAIAEWAGLHTDPDVDTFQPEDCDDDHGEGPCDCTGWRSLAELNDGGSSFLEIAQYIEEQL